jgi:hypothetical protein
MICTKQRWIGVMIAVLALLGMHARPGSVQAAAAGTAQLYQPSAQSLTEFAIVMPLLLVESIISSDGTQVGSGTVAAQARGDGIIATGQLTLTLLWQARYDVRFYESRVTYTADGGQIVSLQGQGEMTDRRGVTRPVTSSFVVQNTSSTTNLDVVVVFDVSASPTSPAYRVTYRLRPTGTLTLYGLPMS